MRTVGTSAIGLMLAALSGCGSLPLTGGLLGKPSAKVSQAASDPEQNPFRRTAKDSTTTDVRDRNRRDSDAPVAASRDNADAQRIRAEIADLPPEKQRAILKEWEQIEPSLRPHYLRVIRNQRLLRQSAGPDDGRRRMTREDDEAPVGADDDPRDSRPRGRTRNRITPAGHGDGPVLPQRNPFGGRASSRKDSREPAGADVPDRFVPRDSANPVSSRPLGVESSDRSLSGTTRRQDTSPKVSPAADGRISTTAAEPFSPEWHRTLQRLIELSDKDSLRDKAPHRKDELTHLRRQVYLRMLYLLSGKTTKAVQAIPNIDAADQEFWQKTLWGISAYLDDRSETDRRSRATQTIARFNEAVEHLRAEADLVVKNVVFCRKIDSFGTFDQVTKAEFRPGEQVLVYAEIENYKSELTAEGHHRTRLKPEIELFQKIGSEYRESKQKFDFPPTEDVCRSYRRDYFHSYILTLPQSLGLGEYVLKLTVTDHVGNKIGSDTVQFTVK